MQRITTSGSKESTKKSTPEISMLFEYFRLNFNLLSRFIEYNIVRNSNEKNSLGKMQGDSSFNMYEVGLSDPNSIRPRDFKHHYQNVPVNIS